MIDEAAVAMDQFQKVKNEVRDLHLMTQRMVLNQHEMVCGHNIYIYNMYMRECVCLFVHAPMNSLLVYNSLYYLLSRKKSFLSDVGLHAIGV